MTNPSMASKNPDIIASGKALLRAARRALELGLNTGTPVYVIKDGEIVDLTRGVSGTATQEAAATVREAPDAYMQAKPARRTVRERKRGTEQKNGAVRRRRSSSRNDEPRPKP